MKTLYCFTLLISVFSAAAARLPSAIQTDWCGGPSPETSWADFGNCFLERENTGWESQERLTLEYPAANCSVFSYLVSGAEIVAGDFDCDGFTDIAPDLPAGAYTAILRSGFGAESRRFCIIR